MIHSLYPIPGSKKRRKYDILKPLPFQKQICEPFMGGAAKSLQLGLKSTLGEINPNFRAIALAPTSEVSIEAYVMEYENAKLAFIDNVALDIILPFADAKQSMKALRAFDRKSCELLDERWKSLTDSLWNTTIRGIANPGLYSFCQRTCFGNVMRLSPKQTGYNVSWHINKLRQALAFDPLQWCRQLQSQGWNPTVYSDWRDALYAVENVEDCYVMLDPPYVVVDEDVRQMTPCYPSHKVCTKEGKDQTLALSIEPLRDAFNRGFLRVDLCNYYSDILDKKVFYLAEKYGYTLKRFEIGVCSALGNSNGRLDHGARRDTRPKPIEYVWRFESIF